MTHFTWDSDGIRQLIVNGDFGEHLPPQPWISSEFGRFNKKVVAIDILPYTKDDQGQIAFLENGPAAGNWDKPWAVRLELADGEQRLYGIGKTRNQAMDVGHFLMGDEILVRTWDKKNIPIRIKTLEAFKYHARGIAEEALGAYGLIPEESK